MHNSFLLTPFLDYSFCQAIHVVQDKIILKDAKDRKFMHPMTAQCIRLDFINISVILPGYSILSLFNIISINNTLKAHERFLHVSPEILNLTC